MPQVADYWNKAGGSYFADAAAALKWLLSRQGAPPSNWLANAVPSEGAQNVAATPTPAAGFLEAGIASQTNFVTRETVAGSIGAPFPQSQVENITLAMPPGLYGDAQLGPDGYPINESALLQPWGDLIVNTYEVTSQLQSYIENGLYTPGSPTISPGDPATAGVIAKWQPNTYYKFGSLIVDHNGNVQIALLNGVTCGGTPECSNTNHPNWPTGLGALTGDYQQVWKLLWLGYTTVKWVATGYCYNLLQPNSYYRADIFVYDTGTNLFYYQGSSSLYRTALAGNAVLNAGTFSVGGVSHLGQIMAVLYPASVAQPGSGSSFSAIPAGWVAHSNMGIGYKLAGYKAQFYLSSGGTETLQEDNIPLIVQPDEYHARAGSSVWPTGAGTPTVRILYDDPVLSWTEVYDSLAGVSGLADLMRSYDIPANDPLYVPNPTSAGSPAIQNRSLMYDNALAILAFSVSGNFSSALGCISAIEGLLANPGSYPAGSLAASYDRLFSRPDQANIDTGAIAWMCLAFSTYIQLSGDNSPWASLQSMLNFLLRLQSADGDSRKNLLYAGYDATLTLETNVAVASNAVAWFAFTRSAPVLSSAAYALLKIAAITQDQSNQLTALATNLQTAAGQIWTALLALYIAPAGSVAGHFPHGLTSAGAVDASEDSNASGSWMALVCDANGDDAKALQCLEYCWSTFLAANQTIALSSASGTYNETYQTAALFSGIKPFNDSVGGYSGSPVLVSSEQTWGLLLALIQLYSVSGLLDYFTGLGTTLDAAIQTLVSGQAAMFQATANGSLLACSAAARVTPWFIYVWPWVAPTAWMYLTEIGPGTILSAALQNTLLPNMEIPAGANQTIDDQQGSSSLGTFSVRVNDTTGVLRSLVGEQVLLGQTAKFKMGFPGLSLGDFVPMHTMQIQETGADRDGWITITLQDLQRYYAGAYLWSSGGPFGYVLGDPTTVQPSGASWLPNSTPVSDKNPRWLAGNPIDLYLAAVQNELGVGQDPALAANIAESAVNTASIATVNPLWQKYAPGDGSTLIHPNPNLDISGILELRDTMFSGDWFEFKITSPMQAKSWLEQNILRPLGLVTVVRNNGQLTLAPMKNPQDQTPVYSFNRSNIIGIPVVTRASIVNALTVRMDVDDSAATTAARSYNSQVSYQQRTSINQFKDIRRNQVEATGLRSAYGGFGRAFLLSDATFRRYAFGTPIYQVEGFLESCRVEIKNYVSLSHPLAEDLILKRRGVVNVTCEVIGRTPNYAKGRMTYKLIDTRPMQLTQPYLIACASAGIPNYGSATPEQQQTYAFVGRNTIF